MHLIYNEVYESCKQSWKSFHLRLYKSPLTEQDRERLLNQIAIEELETMLDCCNHPLNLISFLLFTGPLRWLT